MPDHVACPEDLRAALLRAADAARPRELVAALGGRRGDRVTCVTEFVELGNVARTDDAFTVDPATFAAAEQQLRSRGCSFVGFAHSHPRGVAAPSARDRAELWTGCVQLIAAGGDLRAFWLDPQRSVRTLPLRTAEAAS